MKTIKKKDLLPWDNAMDLIQRLMSHGKHQTALLIGCECYLGAQTKHLLQLTWNDLIHKRQALFQDEKRTLPVDLRVCDQLYEIVLRCHKAMAISDDSAYCFVNEGGEVLSAKDIQRELKEVKKYEVLNLQEFSLTTLRKTFGRKVIQQFGGDQDLALLALCHCFNHLNVKITRRFLNL